MNLTIITAIHNNLYGLKNVIKSLENQTYKTFEHILVDDCSTEISYEDLENLCKDNLHRHFVKLGFRSHYYGCFPRSIGTLLSFSYIHHSKRDIENEWVCFLDTDNLWESNHLQSLIDIAKINPEVTMIASDAKWIGANDINWKKIVPAKLQQGHIDLGQFIYKTSLFRKYGYWFAHPKRKHKYDWELIKKMADGEGDKLVYTHKPTFLMNYKKK